VVVGTMIRIVNGTHCKLSMHELRRWADCGRLAVYVRTKLEDGSHERIIIMWTRVVFFDSAQRFHEGKSTQEVARYLLAGLMSVYSRG